MDKAKCGEQLDFRSPPSVEAKEETLTDQTLEAVDGGYLYADGKFLSPSSKSYEFSQPVLEEGRLCDDKGKAAPDTRKKNYPIFH